MGVKCSLHYSIYYFILLAVLITKLTCIKINLKKLKIFVRGEEKKKKNYWSAVLKKKGSKNLI